MNKQIYIKKDRTYAECQELSKHLPGAEVGDYILFYTPYSSIPRLAVIKSVTKATLEAADDETTRTYTKETLSERPHNGGGGNIIGYIPAEYVDTLRSWLKRYILMRLEDPECDPVKMMQARTAWHPCSNIFKRDEHFAHHNPLAGFMEAANTSY